MRRFRLVDVVISLGVLALVVATLAPAIARMQRDYPDARCQSNLQRWAEAMELYLADNQGCFPTNRGYSGSRPIATALALSPPDPIPPATEPALQYYGANWVEALYSYLQASARGTGQDWKTFRRCPNVSTKTWPPVSGSGYPFPCMTYVLNSNLVERQASVCRSVSKLMMVREFFLTTIAVLRPLNISTGLSTMTPQYAFDNGDLNATTTENGTPQTWKPHAEGSYTLFADGHVHYFSLDYYPKYSQMSSSRCWDPETQQWWNYAPGAGMGEPYLRSIAITP